MKYLIIYLEVKHLLNFLSQAEKGDLLDILLKYTEDEIEPVIENSSVLNVFNFLRSKLDAQLNKAKIKAETARANGAKGGRPSKKKKPKNPSKPTGLIPKPKETQWVIPDFIDADLWNGYLEAKKKKPTELSIKLNIEKLIAWKDKGLDPNEALRNTIENGWEGLFEPKQSKKTGKTTNDTTTIYNNLKAKYENEARQAGSA